MRCDERNLPDKRHMCNGEFSSLARSILLVCCHKPRELNKTAKAVQVAIYVEVTRRTENIKQNVTASKKSIMIHLELTTRK